MRSVIISAATAIILLFAVACSNSSAPTSPGLSEIRATGGSQQVWGVYDLSWDGVSDEMTVVLNRNLEQHYNITPWLFPNNIKLQILDWNTTTKVLTVAAQIQNPFALDGYDVRGILFNLGEIRLLNPDDYTKIFDPNDPKVANPFRAYAKGEENRKFYGVNSPPEDHTKTEVYEIYFPAGFNVSYMVTASYPGNAEEPYDIVSIETTGKIETDGGSIDVTIQVLDWQDVTAESVTLLSNPVTGTDVPMTPDGGDPTFWHATIMNDGGAPIGTYEIWVEANDDTSPDSLYNKFDIDITEAINDPPVIESGVDGNQIPQDDAVELYTVTASDDGGILTYHWIVTDDQDIEKINVPGDLTGQLEIDWGALGVNPGDSFFIECAVSDGVNPPVDATTLQVVISLPPGVWSEPILVSGDASFDEYLPRIVLSSTEYWIIYATNSNEVARTSSTGGFFWSDPSDIDNFGGPDTLHAVQGLNGDIFIQYQHSSSKETYIKQYSSGQWSGPNFNNLHGLTVGPYAADLGISAGGTIFDMWTGDWSFFAHHSEFPYDLSSWIFDNVQTFYNANYSVNDGMVQNAENAKIFFVHDGTQLDYGEFTTEWNHGAAWNTTDTIIEPAIAPESDNPYHGIMGLDKGGTYDVVYFRFDNWPPSSPTLVTLETGLTQEPVYHSISAEGDNISVLYDADGQVFFDESTDGGDTFVGRTSFGPGMFSHIRNDANRSTLMAAYAVDEGSDYNIYVRVRN